MSKEFTYWTSVCKRIFFLILTILATFLLFRLAVFYMPFLIAFIISLIMEPLIRKIMKKFKLSRRTSSIIVFAITFGIILGLLSWGITTLISESTNLLSSLNSYYDKASNTIQNLLRYLDFSRFNISNEILEIIRNTSFDLLQKLSNYIQSLLTKILSGVTIIPVVAIYFAITILALYFICTDKIYMLDELEYHLPDKWMKELTIHIRELSKVLGGYLKAQMVLILISFIICLVGLYILYFLNFNVGFPLIIAIGIGFVDALPILGSGTVMIPWGIISGLNGDLKLGISIIVLWIIMSLVRQFIEPKIVSGNIGIHPIFTIVAMYTGFKFIGVLRNVCRTYSFNSIKKCFCKIFRWWNYKKDFKCRIIKILGSNQIYI